MATIRVRLKALDSIKGRRPKYRICTESERSEINQDIRTVAETANNDEDYLKGLRDIVRHHLPKQPKRGAKAKWPEKSESILAEREQTVQRRDAT